MRRASLRFRLTAWYAAILSIGLALFGGLVWFSLRERLLTEIDRDLNQRAQRFEQYFRAESEETSSDAQLRDELQEFCQALPPSSSIELRGRSGFRFHYAPAAAPNSSRGIETTFAVNGEQFQLEARESADSVLHALQLLQWLLLGMIPAVIAIALIGGAWLSARALKPVNEIAAAARAISIENLSERLPVPPTGDEIARLTEVLNTMLARLESAVRTLSQFAADASHELRTPLSVIRTSAELALRRSRPAEEYRGSLQEIAAETERMTRLVEDLLTLARGDTGAAEMPLEALDAREIVETVCAEMRRLAQLRQINIKLLVGDRSAMIAGNRAALHRLFLVLLDNAVKFSHSGGDVIVAIRASDSPSGVPRVAVSIEDFGGGISEKDLPHIFERFYRADPARSGVGHGLGLALAHSIARSHAASIEVKSGASTIFEVTFPARSVLPAKSAPGMTAGAFSQS